MKTINYPMATRQPVVQPLADTDALRARQWLMVAIGSLILAGVFSLVPLIARIPGLNQYMNDPLLARRFLVVHVNLALGVWIHSFLAGMFFLLPVSRKNSRPLFYAAGAGILMMVASAAWPGSVPILSNYIPMIDNPLFVAGLLTVSLSLGLTFLQGRLFPAPAEPAGFLVVPGSAYPGLRAAALAFLLAMFTFAGSWLTTPAGLPAPAYYEAVLWGGGHVLQFSSVMGMVSAWLILVAYASRQLPLSRQSASLIFGFFLMPLLYAPLLALQGTGHEGYRAGFTYLMRWGIFPFVTLGLLACLAALVRARRKGSFSCQSLAAPCLTGFGISAALTVLGFGLGFLIRGSNTLIPAHYHAAIGGVTAAYMAMTYLFLSHFYPAYPPSSRLTVWQLMLFGLGQAVFAVGFGLAGAHGMGRKVYGTEQVVRTFQEYLGLGLMGLGGLLAIAGGLLFLWLVTRTWMQAKNALRKEA